MAKNQTDLFTVNLIRYTLPLNTKLFCGKLTKEEVLEFMKNITSLKIPVDSCVYKVSVDAQQKIQVHAHLDYEGSGMFRNNSSDATMDISLSMMKDDRKCDSNKCLDNIKSGRCIDPFVRDNIAAKFFANKYTKQK